MWGHSVPYISLLSMENTSFYNSSSLEVEVNPHVFEVKVWKLSSRRPHLFLHCRTPHVWTLPSRRMHHRHSTWGDFYFTHRRAGNYVILKSSKRILVGGWTNPFEKYARQNGFIFPNFRGLSCHHLVIIQETNKIDTLTRPWELTYQHIPLAVFRTFESIIVRTSSLLGGMVILWIRFLEGKQNGVISGASCRSTIRSCMSVTFAEWTLHWKGWGHWFRSSWNLCTKLLGIRCCGLI